MTGSEHLFHQAAQMETRLQGHMQRRMRGMDDYMTLIRLKYVMDYKFVWLTFCVGNKGK